jgi:succinylglutamic semialdehyde dehydrogenase
MEPIKGDFFDGQYHQATNASEKLTKHSPADLSKVLYQVEVDYSHINQVIESAKRAQKKWQNTSLDNRKNLLIKYKEIVASRTNEIAKAIAIETGKPLWESMTEAQALASKVDVTFNDSLARVANHTIKDVMPQIDGHEIKRPIGVSLVIGPFNFPCHLANGQIISALLTGNTVIFKPSEKTILSSQLMFDCLVEAGFPTGVVNLINGTAHTSSKLCEHPQVKAIYFTGSKAVGLKILEKTYNDLSKMVALELGGKNATILHRDANLEHALPELLRACFLTAGQRCTSTSTILIHRSISDNFIEQFKHWSEKIIIDHPIDYAQEPFMGPLIDHAAVDSYQNYCSQAISEGAEALIDFKLLNKLKYQGHYVSPTIHYFKQASSELNTLKTEIFAPNVVFVPYDDIDAAIEMANISEYGLAAAIFTEDKSIYQQCLNELDAGLINLNRSTVGASARLPFGGLKSSGNFRPAGVSMIEHCVHTISSLETMQTNSHISDVKGLG